MNDPIVIVGAARTPMGAFQGELKEFAAAELGAVAIRAAVERAGIKAEEVEEVIESIGRSRQKATAERGRHQA